MKKPKEGGGEGELGEEGRGPTLSFSLSERKKKDLERKDVVVLFKQTCDVLTLYFNYYEWIHFVHPRKSKLLLEEIQPMDLHSFVDIEEQNIVISFWFDHKQTWHFISKVEPATKESQEIIDTGKQELWCLPFAFPQL